MARLYYHYLDAPIGLFLLAGTDTALHFTSFSSGRQKRKPKPDWRADRGALNYAIDAFEAYFSGEAKGFNIPVAPIGTPFQRQVWEALIDIPYGETASYGDIARAVGRPAAFRAVGAANRANHLPVIIPCHRVIGADGTLTGFGGGLEVKEQLLRLEGAFPSEPQADLFI